MKASKIALDIQDLTSAAIIDSLLESGGEVFNTHRKRKAILIGQASLDNLKKKLSLNILEGPDGTGILKD